VPGGYKKEPSSKRGHGDAGASAGGERTATLTSRPLREARAPAVRVRRGRFGTGQTRTVPTSYMLGLEVHASVTCVGFTNDPHSLICLKATRLVSPWHSASRAPKIHIQHDHANRSGTEQFNFVVIY